MADDVTNKPDAFKSVMAAARSEAGRPELAHQSLGRTMTEAESALAAALMEIYADGVSGAADVAAALSKRAVLSPVSGHADWTADSLARDLAALNADFDAAYQENGFGG
jgi:hypothetical protein